MTRDILAEAHGPLRILLCKIALAAMAETPIRNQAIAAFDEFVRVQRGVQVVTEQSSLEELGLCPRTIGILERRGVRHVGGLLALTYEDLLGIRNVGETVAQEVDSAMKRNGFKLGCNGSSSSLMEGDDDEAR